MDLQLKQWHSDTITGPVDETKLKSTKIATTFWGNGLGSTEPQAWISPGDNIVLVITLNQ